MIATHVLSKNDDSINPVPKTNEHGKSRSRRFRIQFGIPNSLEIWTLPFFRSEKVLKFELCHFYVGKLDLIIFNGGKRCGNLDFVIFYVGKSVESWTLLFLLAKKVRKVRLCHFYWRKKLGKLNFIIFNGGKRCGKLDFVIFDDGKVWKIDFAIFYG